jgi:amidase
MQELWKWSACKVVEGLRSGRIQIKDTLQCLEERIKAVDPIINALPTLCFDRARERAERLQSLPMGRRGLLAGLPVAIKDLTEVSGVRTTYGSRIFENFVPTHSDQLVMRLERQGGVIYAKSNTPEFGTGGITFNDVFGITRSPRNLDFSSGGSSGGAAASLAAGCAWLSHGSDMAGSLRTPAAFCGVTSLRPSPGRVRSDSEYRPFAILGAEGPMARSLEDLGLFADALFSDSPESMLAAARDPIKPHRIAFSADLGVTTIDDQVRHQFEIYIERLRRESIETKDTAPSLPNVHSAFDDLRAHEYAIGFEQTLADHPDVMKPEVQWNIRQGLALSASAIRSAQRSQGQIINQAAEFMHDYDLLICPATSVLSVPAELRYPGSDQGVPYSEYYRWLGIAYATTMTALPVITLPVAESEDGMPFAIQLVGKPFGEASLIRHARYIEQFTEWSSMPIDVASHS